VVEAASPLPTRTAKAMKARTRGACSRAGAVVVAQAELSARDHEQMRHRAPNSAACPPSS